MAAEAAAGRVAALPIAPQRIAPAPTDWLYHHLTVTGPADLMAAFRGAAAGAGVIPWTLDFERMEEDFFLRLAAPAVGPRTLSLDAARLLAAELRDAVARRHAAAVARVGRSTVSSLDLHALLPVPADILRLGPDHKEAAFWLWAQWGTTQALRHVALRPGGHDSALRVSFWSADWTPWRALQRIRTDWPRLGFEIRPVYELA